MKRVTVQMVWLLILLALFSITIQAANPDADMRQPDPLVLPSSVPDTWNSIQELLKKLDVAIESESRAEGKLITRTETTTRGVYAASELRKFAVIAENHQSSFHGGRYHLEILVEFLGSQKTQVTVQAIIEGQPHTTTAPEGKWNLLKSNGVLERRFLNELSIAVTGKRAYEKDLPYWKKSDQTISFK